MVSKIPEVFKQLILDEHWLSHFSSYPWSWGVDYVEERIGAENTNLLVRRRGRHLSGVKDVFTNL